MSCNLPAIIRENCAHLPASDREKLLSVLLKFVTLFDGTLGHPNQGTAEAVPT